MPRRPFCLLVCVAAAVLATAAPAQAHPFGAPQTAQITADPATGAVVVHWDPGAADDLSFLAVGLGLAPADHARTPSLMTVKGDVDAMDASPKLDEYLLGHVSVNAGGTACTGAVTSSDDLLRAGATLSFACGNVQRATVDISMLTDLHPAYRTLATGQNDQRFVYSATATSHEWLFGAAAAAVSRTAAARQLALTAVGLAAAAVIALLVARGLRRRRARPSEVHA